MEKLIDHILWLLPVSSRGRRRKDGRSDKPGHGERVGAYGRERRRRGIRACRGCRGHGRKRKGEGGARGAGIKQLRKLIRGALRDADGRDAAGIACPAGWPSAATRTGSVLRA